MLGQRGRVTIDRRRPGVDHAAHTGVAGGHEQVERCVHAVAIGGCGIGYRARNRGQCRLVKNNLNARADPGADRRIGQVALDELHRLEANEVGRLAGNEAVDAPDRAPHRAASIEQGRGNGAANKAGGSRDKIFGQDRTPRKEGYAN